MLNREDQSPDNVRPISGQGMIFLDTKTGALTVGGDNPEIKVVCPCCGRHVQLKYNFWVNYGTQLGAHLMNVSFECPECGLKTDEYLNAQVAFDAWKNREFANWTESAKAFYKKNY